MMESEQCKAMLSSPAWRFRCLHHAHRAAVNASMARCGVPEPGQPFILFALERIGNGSIDTQRELAERLGLSPATVTASLKALEKQGYVRRVTDENDMRRKRIEITERGREAEVLCRRAFVQVDDVMYRGFSETELSQLSSFFDRMTENLRREYGERGECE
jgi:DNA-binding MarR family transcriptional regulator